jgi:hypothetical protein
MFDFFFSKKCTALLFLGLQTNYFRDIIKKGFNLSLTINLRNKIAIYFL